MPDLTLEAASFPAVMDWVSKEVKTASSLFCQESLRNL